MTAATFNYSPFEAQPEYERTILDAVGDYLSRIASAVVSLIKRILCIQDPVSVQDLIWAKQKCRQLEFENHLLKQNIKILEKTNLDKHTHSIIQTCIVEGILFLSLMPLYIISLPVTLLRASMYSSTTKPSL